MRQAGRERLAEALPGTVKQTAFLVFDVNVSFVVLGKPGGHKRILLS